MVLCKINEDITCDPDRTNRLCYANLSGFDESTLDENGCACNTFYGWDGANCDQLTFSTWFTIIVMGLTFVFSGFYFVHIVRLFVLSYKYEELWTSKFITILLLGIGAFGNTGWSLMVMSSAATTSGSSHVLSPEKYSDPFFGRWNFFSLFFGPIAVFGTSLAIINVAILWIDTSKGTRQLSEKQTSSYILNRRILLGIVAFGVVLNVIAFGYEKLTSEGTSVSGFANSVPIFMGVAWYILAYLRFMPILNSASMINGSTPIIESTKKIVHVTTGRVLIAMICYFFGTFVFSSLDTIGGTWKAFSAVGEVKAAKFFHHLQPVSLLMAIVAIYKYLLVLATNGGMYIIIGFCNAEMVENPNYNAGIRNALGVSSPGPGADTEFSQLNLETGQVTTGGTTNNKKKLTISTPEF